MSKHAVNTSANPSHPTPPQLPSQASSTAVDVHSQLANGTIPPSPPHPTMPQLPTQASSTAKDVLNQLSTGTIPPSPLHPTKSDLLSQASSSDLLSELTDSSSLTLPELPSQASSTAFDVFTQLANETIPPSPTHPSPDFDSGHLSPSADTPDFF